jgi:hypothetical protein
MPLPRTFRGTPIQLWGMTPTRWIFPALARALMSSPLMILGMLPRKSSRVSRRFSGSFTSTMYGSRGPDIGHLVDPVGKFQGVLVRIDERRDQVFGVDDLAQDFVHGTHEGGEVRGGVGRVVDAQAHGVQQRAFAQGVAGHFDGGDVHAQAGHAGDLALRVHVGHGVPADEAARAEAGQDYRVRRFRHSRRAGIQNHGHGFALVGGDHHFEPVAPGQLLFAPAGQFLQERVGEDDSALPVQGHGDAADAAAAGCAGAGPIR